MTEKTRVTVDGEEFEVEVEFNGEQWDVTIEGKTFAIVVDQGMRSAQRTASERVSRRISGSGTISSAIPGKIVSIHVSEGEIVSEGDVVLVLEAMKMQNEIQAAVSGIIISVNCEEGQSIEANIPLVVIEPHAEEGEKDE